MQSNDQPARSAPKVMLGIALWLLASSANTQMLFSAKAISGKVADAETGEPLSGVIVVAEWKIDHTWVGHDRALLEVLETVSDKDGSYTFPAWGPIVLPPLADFGFGDGRDPAITYYKTGYWPGFESNPVTLDAASRTPPIGEFAANGATIKLRKWTGEDPRAYYEKVRLVATNIPNDSGREWRKYPRMTLAMEDLRNKLSRQPGIAPNILIPRIEGFRMDSLSIEDREFLRSFVK